MKTKAKGFHNDCPHNRNILWGEWAVAYMLMDGKDGEARYATQMGHFLDWERNTDLP